MIEKPEAGYRYLPGLIFASQAVAAVDGMAMERACFPRALPLREGFDAVSATMEKLGRPMHALCGFDLRLPSARRVEDFLAFNAEYLDRLRSWDLLEGESSPLARTNVAPVADGIDAPAVAGFSYTVPRSTDVSAFVISGAPEVPDDATGPDDVIRLGESDQSALSEKLDYVVGSLKARLEAATECRRELGSLIDRQRNSIRPGTEYARSLLLCFQQILCGFFSIARVSEHVFPVAPKLRQNLMRHPKPIPEALKHIQEIVSCLTCESV